MTTALKLEMLLIVAGSSAIALALTFFILKKMGRISPAAGLAMDEQLSVKLRRDSPAFARLSAPQQQALVRAVRVHPLIWIFVTVVLGLFLWTALSVPQLLDWINQGPRSAAIIGIVVLIVTLGGIALIRRLLIARALAKLG